MENSKIEAMRHRRDIVSFYRNKYYSLWMNSRKWTGLSYSQNYYIMKELYARGTILVFDADTSKAPSEKGREALSGEDQDGQTLIITPYAATEWNAYGQPVKPLPINIKGLSVIPSKALDATNSVVIWAHTSHKSIEYLVNYWVEQIADVQIALDMNLYVQRVPKLYTCTPADEKRVKEIANKIDAGVRQLFITADDWQAIQQVMDSGQNYILDKLLKYRQQLESEILNLLGINSIQYEKEERITDEEATANDAQIQLFSGAITDTMRDGAKRVKEILGYDLDVIETFRNTEPKGKGDEDNENESQTSEPRTLAS